MDAVTLNRLGQIRQQEIAAMAALDQERRGFEMRRGADWLGRFLLSWGARLASPRRSAETPCPTVRDSFGRTISVCSPT